MDRVPLHEQDLIRTITDDTEGGRWQGSRVHPHDRVPGIPLTSLV